MLTLMQAMLADTAVAVSWDTEEPLDPSIQAVQQQIRAHAFVHGTGRVVGGVTYRLVDGAVYQVGRAWAEGFDPGAYVQTGECGAGCSIWMNGPFALLKQEHEQGVVLVSAHGGAPVPAGLLEAVRDERGHTAVTPALHALREADAGALVRSEQLLSWGVLGLTREREGPLAVWTEVDPIQAWLDGAGRIGAGLGLLGSADRELHDVALRQVGERVQLVGSLTAQGAAVRRARRDVELPSPTGGGLEAIWVGDGLARVAGVEPLPVEATKVGRTAGACGPACTWSLVTRPSAVLATLTRDLALPSSGMKGAVLLATPQGPVEFAVRLRSRWLARRLVRSVGPDMPLERDGALVYSGSFQGSTPRSPGLELVGTQELFGVRVEQLNTRVEHGALVVEFQDGELPVTDVGWQPVKVPDGPDGCLERLWQEDFMLGAADAGPETQRFLWETTAERQPVVADGCASAWPDNAALQVMQGQAHAVRGLLTGGFWTRSALADLIIACDRGQSWACHLQGAVPMLEREPVVMVNGVGDTSVQAHVWVTVHQDRALFVDGECALDDAPCLAERMPTPVHLERPLLGLHLQGDQPMAALATLAAVSREHGVEWVQSVLGAVPYASIELYPVPHAEVDRHAVVRVTDDGWDAFTTAPVPSTVTDRPDALRRWVEAQSRSVGTAQVLVDAPTWAQAVQTADVLLGGEGQVAVGLLIGDAD